MWALASAGGAYDKINTQNSIGEYVNFNRAFFPLLVFLNLILPIHTAIPQINPLYSPVLLDLPRLKNGKLIQISSYDTTGGNLDYVYIEKDSRAVLADIKGPGILVRIWVTISSKDPFFLRRILLRIYWDGEDSPSVEVPVGDFFGTGFQYTHYTSALIGMSSGGYYSYIPMPFNRSARIEVMNQTGTDVSALYYQIEYLKLPKFTKDYGYFHAQWRREPRTRKGENYVILEARGRGHFIGLNMSMQGYAGSFNFLEGDEMIYVDGESSPSIAGTGTEDFFNSGWYFNKGVYSALSHGLIIKDKQKFRISAYRFFITDAIPFTSSITVTIEHGHNNDVIADYSSTAYWYQKEPHLPFPPMPGASMRIPMRAIVPEGGVEAEDLLERASVHDGSIEKADTKDLGPEWSGDQQLIFKGKGEGSYFNLDFPVDVKDKYRLILYITKTPHGGLFSVSFKDRSIGLIDGYATSIEPPFKVEIDDLVLEPNQNMLTFTVKGKNELSSGYNLGLDCLFPEPVREFVKEWNIIGPFDNPGEGKIRKGLSIVYPPEKHIDLTAEYPGKGGKTVKWKKVKAWENGYVDLNSTFEDNDFSVAYATTYVFSPTQRKTVMYIGSDDGVKVWLNGVIVHENPILRPAAPDQDRVEVTLKRGWNGILIKIEEGLGWWGFYLRIPNPDGDLKFSTEIFDN